MASFKIKLIGSNDDGSRIFAVLRYGKARLVKGFYDFNTEKFNILEWKKKNFPQGYTKENIMEILRQVLLLDYDWEL